jgi:hypothetical protein
MNRYYKSSWNIQILKHSVSRTEAKRRISNLTGKNNKIKQQQKRERITIPEMKTHTIP